MKTQNILLLLCLSVPVWSLAQVDKKATPLTKNLYQNLHNLAGKGTLFGHQDALAYGLNADGSRWIGEENRSDLKTVTGEHPAVAGWDLGKLEFDSLNNLDGVPFALMRQRIIEHHQRGGISTLSWHSNNPVDPSKTTWDKVDSTIRRTLKNRDIRKNYQGWLGKVATFAKSLQDPQTGELIPIIFRPYHEHTGSWFWWGAGHCTPKDYKKFWRFTQKYLQKKQKIHHFLYAYSTDRFRSKEHYLERYPGDKKIDLLGFDIYHRNAPLSNEQFVKDTKQMVAWLKEMGQEHAKITAITETGLEKVTEANWWTNIVAPILQDAGLSYILVWRNGRADHFYAPYPGQVSEQDFLEFIRSSNILLENKTAALNLFKH
jgi:mannan endo-1,4-beta-mannosidase